MKHMTEVAVDILFAVGDTPLTFKAIENLAGMTGMVDMDGRNCGGYWNDVLAKANIIHIVGRDKHVNGLYQLTDFARDTILTVIDDNGGTQWVPA